jgi:hypothetical protein
MVVFNFFGINFVIYDMGDGPHNFCLAQVTVEVLEQRIHDIELSANEVTFKGQMLFLYPAPEDQN